MYGSLEVEGIVLTRELQVLPMHAEAYVENQHDVGVKCHVSCGHSNYAYSNMIHI